jgi:hypothetical protein
MVGGSLSHGGHSNTPSRHRPSLSPTPRRGRTRPQIIVKRTVKEANATVQYPMLTRTNYEEWEMLMRVNMEAAGIWYAIEPYEGEEVEYRDDRLALAAILRSVPTEMLPTLRGKRTAQAAWEAVRTIRVGVERVRESKAQQLRREFVALGWKEGESAEDFSVRITGLANSLRVLGDNISDADIIRKMLDTAPEHLERIAVVIETLLDLNDISVEEVTGRLRAIEQRRRKAAPVVDSQGRLLLTQEEWKAKLRIGEKGSSSGSSGSGGSGGSGSGARSKRTSTSRDRRRGNGGTRQATGPGDGLGGQPKKGDKCRYCEKKGHWAKECRSRLRDEAHLAQGEEEEESMLMVAIAEVNAISSLSPQISTAPPGGTAPIHLDESRLFVQLGDEHQGESTRWILDTGATNHMTGARSAFSELDTGIRGTVKFGDGSVVGIEGRGTVLFKCKGEEHQALEGVYHIPRLTANIVSLGQLDEEKYKWSCEDGVLRIWNMQRRLLAKVVRSANRLYILKLDIARPVCLVA